MKYFNKTTLVVGFFLLFANWSAAQNLVTIGTGTSTARQPHGVFWGFERSTAIYQASEIGRSGVIEKLNWYITASQSGNYGVRIYLANTTANNFGAATTYANEVANARLVYADTGQVPSTGQWVEFTLDDTFSYYNSENLKVIVETNAGGTGQGNGTFVRYTTTTTYTNTHQYWNADNTPPTGTGTRTSNRPNLQIGFVPDPVPDLLIAGFVSPGLAGCNVSAYDLEFQVGNGGGAAISSGAYIRYGYTVNNGSEVLDSFQLTSNLAINGTVNHTIPGITASGIPNLNFKV